MAPKSKPRGLKASSKVVAVAPPEAEAVERTFPLDEDALTLSDLFELRSTSSVLLSSSSSTAEQVDEAASLLRGILHGCESLLALFASVSPSCPSFFAVPLVLPTDIDTVPRLTALGLTLPLAPSQVAYLQGSALHDLASILPPPPSHLALSSALGGSKKRKVDVREPTKAEEWLDEASERYQTALEAIPATATGADGWRTLVEAESARAKSDRAVLAFLSESRHDDARKHLDGTQTALDSAVKAWVAHSASSQVNDEDENPLPSSPAALLRALASFLALYDSFSSPTSLTDIRLVKSHSDSLSSLSTLGEKQALELVILGGDARMAEFVLLAEAVEDKYRPVESDEEEDDEEEVVQLPDADDVREAKETGRDAIDQIRKSIKLLVEATDGDVAVLKKAQYLKVGCLFT